MGEKDLEITGGQEAEENGKNLGIELNTKKQIREKLYMSVCRPYGPPKEPHQTFLKRLQIHICGLRNLYSQTTSMQVAAKKIEPSKR